MFYNKLIIFSRVNIDGGLRDINIYLFVVHNGHFEFLTVTFLRDEKTNSIILL